MTSRDWSRVRPHPRHRLIARCAFAINEHELSPGLVLPPAKHLNPFSIPQYQRKRLIRFLEGASPVLPAFLDSLLPRNEALDARRLYQHLRRSGETAGDAILNSLGLFVKWPTVVVPKEMYAQIIRASCDCDPVLECSGGRGELLLRTGIGEPLDDDHRAIWCHEFLAVVPPAAERLRARSIALVQERIGFARLRVSAAPETRRASVGA